MKKESEQFPAIFAIRMAEKEGWHIFNPPVTRERIKAYMEGQGLTPIEYNELLVVLEQQGDFTELEFVKVAGTLIEEKGWSYDARYQCWRAPGEIISEPSDEPAFAVSFDVKSESPKAGWWELCFIINGKEYWIASSEVYDPIGDYHSLILAVIHGQNARITVNEESCYTEISIYSKQEGMIRFVIRLLGTKEPQRGDMLIDGYAFVKKFYAVLSNLFRDKEGFERGWLMEPQCLFEAKYEETYKEYIQDIKNKRDYPSYPDSKIEEYLVAQRPPREFSKPDT